MKKAFFSVILTCYFIRCAIPANAQNSSARATFDKIWIDYDVTEDGVRGMRIHLKFTTYGMKDMDAYAAIYFMYDDERGGYIKDKNQKIRSSDGNVALYKALKPAYDPSEYNDLQLFMPYEEFDLSAGVYNLAMDVQVIYQKGGTISKLTNYKFKFTQPETTTATVSVTFDNLWVDYDVMEGGRKGMRIHAKFKTYSLKNVDGYLAVYFEKSNGDKLYTNNETYRSKSGQVAVFRSIKPQYDDAVYDDLQAFMPYDELNLPSGSYTLKMDADVIYKNGDMIKHLTYKEFTFSK